MPDSKTILLIEDDKLLLKILEENLRKGGLQVLSARSAEEGLEMALAHHPNLIILDILLIEMDGLGFLSELRKDGWGSQVPVIVLTNVGDAAMVNEARKKGIREDDYLKKADYDLQGVLQKVQARLAEIPAQS
jgi:DNA-binding response OmpR family regulator